MADGARTHDNWNHNPGLYQLSYNHHIKLACPTGIEPVTPSLENWCSIRLSYGQLTNQIKRISGAPLFIIYIGRGGEIRTPDILLPKQARYQATLHPERANIAYLLLLVKHVLHFLYYTLAILLMFFINILLKYLFIKFRFNKNDSKNY